MQNFEPFAKILIVAGLVLIIGGLFLFLAGKVPGLGKLPGDFYFKGQGFTFYFPLTTSVLLSVIVSLILWFLRRK